MDSRGPALGRHQLTTFDPRQLRGQEGNQVKRRLRYPWQRAEWLTLGSLPAVPPAGEPELATHNTAAHTQQEVQQSIVTHLENTHASIHTRTHALASGGKRAHQVLAPGPHLHLASGAERSLKLLPLRTAQAQQGAHLRPRGPDVGLPGAVVQHQPGETERKESKPRPGWMLPSGDGCSPLRMDVHQEPLSLCLGLKHGRGGAAGGAATRLGETEPLGPSRSREDPDGAGPEPAERRAPVGGGLHTASRPTAAARRGRAPRDL